MILNPQAQQQQPPQQGGQRFSNPQQKGGDSSKSGYGDGKKKEDDEAEKAAVQQWTSRIKRAKEKWKKDFKRMRDNMNFAAGLQWDGQKEMVTKKYVANITNREVNAKVAQLYAKNPTAEYQRRPRLDFQIYDGKLENVAQLVAMAGQNPMGMMAMPPQAQALMLDFAHGMQERQLIDKVGKTLEILFQYCIDEQNNENGDFVIQMKKAVRQCVTTGVAYCGVAYVNDADALVTSTGVADTTINRAKMVKQLLEKVEKGELNENSPNWQQLRNLMSALGQDVTQQLQQPDINERLVFDFIPSTSIIPDPKCRSLKGFIGAHWIVQEFCLPINDVKSLFECPDLSTATSKAHQPGKGEDQGSRQSATPKDESEQEVTLWRLLNKKDKTECWLVDGYKCYVQKPEHFDMATRGFWPIEALTFNDVEIEEGLDATIFPPSDVQLMWSAQREWNRSRNELVKHRKANAPGWITIKGMLTRDDKTNLEEAPTNGVTELEGVPLGTPLEKIFTPRPHAPIEGSLYDTTPLAGDIQATTGGSGQMPPSRGHQTATAQTVEQQQKMSVTDSNVDDLDKFLSGLAAKAGELILMNFQIETVKRIAGPGAVIPQMGQNREDFVNQIFLTTKAASSGRPNKAIELRNWQIVGPMLQQLGANPQFLVRETLRRLDDQLDPEQAFPLQMPMMNAGNQPPQGGQHQPSPQGQHVPGQTQPPQQGRPGPGQQEQTPQNEANQRFAQQ